jgi:hypothetical protein
MLKAHRGTHFTREFIGFHRDWKDLQEGGDHCLTDREKREREDRGQLTEGEQKGCAGRRRWRPPERRGRRRALGIAKNREAAGAGWEKKASGPVGLGADFKNARWAHRTVYSGCPVHTGQRTVAVR